MSWTYVIRAEAALINVSPKEVWHYRDLIRLLVWRDFISVYKQTVLGPLWFLLQPMITTIVYTVVFGKIAKIPTDGMPPFLFYMAGIGPWTYFAACFTATSNTFVNNAGLFGKVYFPRLIVPIATAITNLITFGVQLLFFLVFLAYFALQGSEIRPNILLLLCPLLLLLMVFLALGAGMILSALTVRYRDLLFVLGFGVQLWMYATPIVYPLSQVPEEWQWVFYLNPLAAPIECFRFAFLGSGAVSFAHLALSALITALIFLSGLMLFCRAERTFVDTI